MEDRHHLTFDTDEKGKLTLEEYLVACNSDIGIELMYHEGCVKERLDWTASERRELGDRMRSRTLPPEDVRRARLILLLAQGQSYLAIRHVLGCNANYISRWKGRFEAERLAGLYSHHPRTRGGEAHPGAGGQNSGMDSQSCAGWLHALEQPQVGATRGY